MTATPVRSLLVPAFALALGAAVSLGLARFAYGLLLPSMRADLGWSYFTAGAMNTLNAAGYLAGALAAPQVIRCAGARRVLIVGSLAAAILLALHGAARGDALLYALRFATGVASAGVFVAGGLMAARQGLRPDRPEHLSPGLLLGIYYGGTGLGIVASALVLPALGDWRLGWFALAGLAALAALAMRASPHDAALPPAAASPHGPFRLRAFGFGLAGYFMFGLGYIGYMTFIVTLLREQQLSALGAAAFFALLGAGVMASPWLWAGLLQRHRGGQPLARLSALLALATLLPVLSTHIVAAFASGALFGAVFLSVVASTTALVRHNLPHADWPAGISAFTIVFALGQIAGPSLVGRLADGAGGLRAGLAVSAAVLALGALLALLQKSLPAPH